MWDAPWRSEIPNLRPWCAPEELKLGRRCGFRETVKALRGVDEFVDTTDHARRCEPANPQSIP